MTHRNNMNHSFDERDRINKYKKANKILDKEFKTGLMVINTYT